MGDPVLASCMIPQWETPSHVVACHDEPHEDCNRYSVAIKQLNTSRDANHKTFAAATSSSLHDKCCSQTIESGHGIIIEHVGIAVVLNLALCFFEWPNGK